MSEFSWISVASTFVASLKSIGTACTLAGVGVYLHQNGCIPNEGKRTLALITQQVTFPLYLFTKILYCNQDWSDNECPDVTKTLQEAWILVIWPLFVVGSGIFVGWLVTRITNVPSSQKRPVIAACAFGNSNGLPITLLTVIHANFPTSSDLGRMDPSLFLSVYLLLYPALQWGIGGWMLAPTMEEELEKDAATNETTSLIEKSNDDENESSELPLTTPPRRSLNHDTNSSRSISRRSMREELKHNVLNNTLVDQFYKNHRHGLSSADEGLYVSELDLVGLLKQQIERESQELAQISTILSRENPDENSNALDFILENSSKDGTSTVTPPVIPNPNQRMTSTGTLTSYGTTDHNHRDSFDNTQQQDNNIQIISTERLTKRKWHDFKYDADTIWQSAKKVFDRCFQPPVIGSILGIIAAMTPIRGYFVDIVDRRSHAPLQWFFDGLYSVGQTSVPINMIILGCNLSSSSQKMSYGDGGPFSLKTSIGIVIGKMLILPMIGIISVLLLKLYVLKIDDMVDGSFYLVMLIVFLCPTANNVMVMVELSGSDAKEGIARVIALQYAVAPIILSLSMTISIALADTILERDG